MANITLTNEELDLCTTALETEIKSVSRAQKASKAPQFAELYKTQEAHLRELQIKLTKAKTK